MVMDAIGQVGRPVESGFKLSGGISTGCGIA